MCTFKAVSVSSRSLLNSTFNVRKTAVLHLAVLTLNCTLFYLRLNLQRQLSHGKVHQGLSNYLLKNLQFFESIRELLLPSLIFQNLIILLNFWHQSYRKRSIQLILPKNWNFVKPNLKVKETIRMGSERKQQQLLQNQITACAPCYMVIGNWWIQFFKNNLSSHKLNCFLRSWEELCLVLKAARSLFIFTGCSSCERKVTSL